MFDYQDYKNNFIITIIIYNLYLYLQFDFYSIMSNNQNIVEIYDNDGITPPHPESYYQDENNEYVYISNLSQPSERDENLRMARFLAQKTKENVYILPLIQPTQKNAKSLRKDYFPEGVKENKNPDFYFRGRFVDGKCMSKSELKTQKLTKRNIQNRLKEAYIQADDAFLEIPLNFPFKWIEEAVRGKLNSMSHFHIVYLEYGDNLFIFQP